MKIVMYKVIFSSVWVESIIKAHAVPKCVNTTQWTTADFQLLTNEAHMAKSSKYLALHSIVKACMKSLDTKTLTPTILFRCTAFNRSFFSRIRKTIAIFRQNCVPQIAEFNQVVVDTLPKYLQAVDFLHKKGMNILRGKCCTFLWISINHQCTARQCMLLLPVVTLS